MLEQILYAINILLLLALFVFGIQIFIYFPKVDIELLKARMFLNKPLMNRMWLTSVLSGALFVFYEATRTFAYYNIFEMAGLESIAILAFLVPYLGLTYQWYRLLKLSLVKRKD